MIYLFLLSILLSQLIYTILLPYHEKKTFFCHRYVYILKYTMCLCNIYKLFNFQPLIPVDFFSLHGRKIRIDVSNQPSTKVIVWHTVTLPVDQWKKGRISMFCQR